MVASLRTIAVAGFILMTVLPIKADSVDLAKIIGLIDSKFNGRPLMSYSDLFAIKEFKNLWEAADQHIDDALAFYETRPKEEQMFTAQLAMQNLSALNLSSYLQYCRKVLDLRRRNIVTDDFLKSVVVTNSRIANLEGDSAALLREIKDAGYIGKTMDRFLSGAEQSGPWFWRSRGPYWPLRGD